MLRTISLVFALLLLIGAAFLIRARFATPGSSVASQLAIEPDNQTEDSLNPQPPSELDQADALPRLNSKGAGGTTRLLTELRSEASRLYKVGEDERASDARTAKLAASLNASDANELKTAALSPSLPESERFLAVYLLGERARDFKLPLMEIARTPAPLAAPGPELAAQAEMAVRIQAMLALDAIGVEPEVKSLFAEIERSQTHPVLRRLAHLGAQGAMQRQPMLANYIDMEMSEIMDEVD